MRKTVKSVVGNPATSAYEIIQPLDKRAEKIVERFDFHSRAYSEKVDILAAEVVKPIGAESRSNYGVSPLAVVRQIESRIVGGSEPLDVEFIKKRRNAYIFQFFACLFVNPLRRLRIKRFGYSENLFEFEVRPVINGVADKTRRISANEINFVL